MATIRHIDKEAYAAKALELLNDRREEDVNYVLGLFKDNLTSGMARERLEERVCSDMENLLFSYLERSGKISGGYRYQYYHVTGCYRAVRREPQKRDVPSELLDIREVLPGFEEIMGEIMMEAEKRRMVEQIETITKEAKDPLSPI